MMILKLIGCIILFIILILVGMSIIVGALRTKANTRIIYKMDKVVTRTGGLAHDRIYENIEKEDIIMDEMEKKITK